MALKEYQNKFIIIKIPVVSRAVCGKKVGYKINRIQLKEKVEKNSATKIRKKK